MKQLIEIYSEQSDKAPFTKAYQNEQEAIEDFIEYTATNNTGWDGVEDDVIRDEISLSDIASEYYGSWGRVLKVGAHECTYGEEFGDENDNPCYELPYWLGGGEFDSEGNELN